MTLEQVKELERRLEEARTGTDPVGYETGWKQIVSDYLNEISGKEGETIESS